MFYPMMIFQLYVTLIDIIHINERSYERSEKKSYTVICSSMYEVAICWTALELAKREKNCRYMVYLPTLGNTKSVSNFEGIILTDLNGVAGLEFPNVIVP